MFLIQRETFAPWWFEAGPRSTQNIESRLLWTELWFGLVWFDAHSAALSVCPDVISIEKTGEHFRLIYDVKGRFTVHRITAEEAKVRGVTFNNSLQPHRFYASFPGPCHIFANLSRCCLFEMDVRSLKSAIISCHWRCFRTIFKSHTLRNVVLFIRTIGSTVLAATLELATSHMQLLRREMVTVNFAQCLSFISTVQAVQSQEDYHWHQRNPPPGDPRRPHHPLPRPPH